MTKPALRGVEPYVQGKSTVDGVRDPIKLSSNESLYGPSPAAVEAMRRACSEAHLYPDGAQSALRRAIAEVHGLRESRVLCGNGSDETISLLMKALLVPGDEAVVSQYSFVMAAIHAKAMGAHVIDVAEPELKPDVDALLRAVTPRTRVVVLATPNNPVGRYVTRDELHRLRAGLGDDVVLLIDAAYGDYVVAEDYADGSDLVDAETLTVMTRTFSKLYGLSGLRIGWAYLPENLHRSLEQIRTPFNTNGVALAAAEAAVRDSAFADDVRRRNAAELARIEAATVTMDLEFIPSFANFYLLRFAGDRHTAAGAARHLESHGVIPRDVGAGGPAQCLRITVGRSEDNDAVIAALRDYLER